MSDNPFYPATQIKGEVTQQPLVLYEGRKAAQEADLAAVESCLTRCGLN